jgi:hypothetical protein
VPDLPGYGASAPLEQNDKLSVGRVVLSALKSEVKKSKGGEGGTNLQIILIGHDRGARVAHHLTVSGVESVEILGVCLIDIVSKSPFQAPLNILSNKLTRSQPHPNGSTSSLPPPPQKK